MKKCILFYFLVLSICSSAKPIQPVDVVQAYADNLSAWCDTKDVSRYSDAIKELCSDGFRVNDEIVCDWIRQKKMQELTHYDFNDYEKCLEDLITKKGVKIKINNIAVDNSVEFSIANYGDSEPLAFVSADMSVEGYVNYHTKEIFKIRNGKIVIISNYESEKLLGKAFLMCKQGKFKEAYDIFENVMYTTSNYRERLIAEDFATSILLKKSGQLKMDEYVRKYKLARNILRSFGSYSTRNLPILNDKTYSDYAQNCEEALGSRKRAVVLPAYWEKAIPYIASSGRHHFDIAYNLWVYRYYEDINTHYRQAEKKRFPKKSKKLYGFVDSDGKDVIPAQYQFAYPFDEKYGLALVQHSNGKWGYIDMEGKPRTQQNYDVASDVFVDGKTNVIRDGYLMLIDTEGNEIKSIYGYTDLSHKLGEDEMLAVYSVGALRYDLIDFNGNIIETALNKEKGPGRVYFNIGGCTFGHISHIINQK